MAAALLGVGLSSCDKEDNNGGNNVDNNVVNNGDNNGDDNGDNGGNNGGDNGGDVNGGDTTTVQWVDLGLPSGLLWADRNVGAESPEDYGNYYAWGETSPKEVYDWSTYAYGNDPHALTKYCKDSEYGLNGFTDNLTVLEASDDAATVNLGGDARTPTYNEWHELMNNTNSTWTTRNGVNGRLLTASNGNSIFLPAASCYSGSSNELAGLNGHYWSSEQSLIYQPFRPYFASEFYFVSNIQGAGPDALRSFGLSVRAVRAGQN